MPTLAAPRIAVLRRTFCALLLCAATTAHAGTADDIERAVTHDPRAVATKAQTDLAAARTRQHAAATLLALRQLIRVRVDIDETAGTRELINEALALAERLKDTDATAELRVGDAMLSHVLGEAHDTDARFERAIAFAEFTKQPYHLARALIQHARWLEHHGRGADAMVQLNRAYTLAEQQGDRFAMSRALNGVAGAIRLAERSQARKTGETVARYKAALALVDPEVYRTYAVRLWHNLADMLLFQGELDEARQVIERALAMAGQLDYTELQSFLLALLVDLELKSDQPASALAALNRIGAERTRSGNTTPLPASLRLRLALMRADALSRTGDRPGSAQALDAARAVLPALPAPRWAVRVHEVDAMLAERRGDFEAAYRAAGRMREAEKADLNANNSNALAELRTRFDVERKDYENNLLRARERESEARRELLWVALAASVALFGGLALWAQLRLQKRLRAAAALKAAIVDHAMQAIVTADSNGRIVEFNRAAEAMFGIEREQAIGRDGAMLLPDSDHERAQQVLAQLQRGDGAELLGRRWTLRARRAGGDGAGNEFPIEAVMWRSEVDGTVLYSASARDVTAQARSAEIIERQRNELRQSEKLTTMGNLLAGVAHELNNPLAVVMGRASLLEEMADGTPMASEAKRVHAAAQRCSRIVRTFLNMARQRSATRSEVQLNDVVQGAAEMLGYALRTHATRVELQLAPDLPVVTGDGDQFGQVVLNLIVNAQQAMAGNQGPQGRATPSPPPEGVEQSGEATFARDRERVIRIQTGSGDGRLWLRVADTGPGVPPEVAERIFMPFFTTKGEGVGTGMGLAVSRTIARDHGGDLELEPSTLGAAFLLWLPLQPAAALTAPATAATEGAAAVPEATAQPATLDAGRVLVVDDEPELADLMREMLESAGFDVTTAESGGVALEMLTLGRFDAIVSDIRMPDIDGAGLWRAVKERAPALASRMLFVTGDTLSANAAVLLDETGCPALEKPFSAADLVAKLRALPR